MLELRVEGSLEVLGCLRDRKLQQMLLYRWLSGLRFLSLMLFLFLFLYRLLMLFLQSRKQHQFQCQSSSRQVR